MKCIKRKMGSNLGFVNFLVLQIEVFVMYKPELQVKQAVPFVHVAHP